MANALKLAVPLFCLSLSFAGTARKTYKSGEVDLRIEKGGIHVWQ